MSQAEARSWWSDVEHLREAAERRIAEREAAQREGRAPAALTPLRQAEAPGLSGLAGWDAEDVDFTPRGERFARDAREGAPAGDRRPRLAVVADPPPSREAVALREAPLHDAPLTEEPRDVREQRRRFEREERPAGRDAAARALATPLPTGHPTAPAAAARVPAPVPGRAAARRTVEITGKVVPLPVRVASVETGGRRRPRRRPAEMAAAHPDRVALWAFFLGLFLIIVAVLSG